MKLAALSLVALSAVAIAPSPVTIDEWTVPWERSRPRDPYVAPDGSVWFVGQVGNYVARLEPASGKFTRFAIDSGTHPHNLVVARDGMVWYAGNRNGMIGRLDPATGNLTRYSMPDPAVRDPHTLVFDRAGDIWFTAQQAGYVGKLDTKSGAVRVVKVAAPNARPYGIVMDADGAPWFAAFGTNMLGRIDPRTMAVKEYRLPHEGARVRRLETTRDGMVWYADWARGMLGRLDPATGAAKEWAMPGGVRSHPYAMAKDDRERLWMVETGTSPNRFVAFDPKTEQFVATAPIAKSGGGSVRHMTWHGPTRAIWFGTDMNTVGRAKLE